MISIIAAVAKNSAIGKDNRLLWHLSEDLRHFKRTTLGSPVIMGYNTFLSIGKRPLPERRNLVVNHALPDGLRDGVECFSDLPGALRAAATSRQEIFIIGGGMLYRSAISLADRLYITEINETAPDADTFFPAIDPALWQEISRSEPLQDQKAGVEFSFVVYERRQGE